MLRGQNLKSGGSGIEIWLCHFLRLHVALRKLLNIFFTLVFLFVKKKKMDDNISSLPSEFVSLIRTTIHRAIFLKAETCNSSDIRDVLS